MESLGISQSHISGNYTTGTLGAVKCGPTTITSHLGRMKAVVERIQASASQAEASADNLISAAPKCASNGSGSNSPEPSGLLNQMEKVLVAAETHLNRLGVALDRIDQAHG